MFVCTENVRISGKNTNTGKKKTANIVSETIIDVERVHGEIKRGSISFIIFSPENGLFRLFHETESPTD